MTRDLSTCAREVPGGSEWLVDAHGCDSDALQSVQVLQRLFDQIVDDLSLHPLAAPFWHVFPGTAGISGMLLLSESHLTCHTFPEHGLAAFNLYCCRARRPWPWNEHLSSALGARTTTITVIDRGQRVAEQTTQMAELHDGSGK